MESSIHKNRYQHGDILLIRTPLKRFNPMSWLSWIIRQRIGLNYNHVALVADWGDTSVVVEANEGGIKTTPTAARLFNRQNDILILRPFQVPEDFLERVVDRQGHGRYGVMDLIFYHLLHTFGLPWYGRTDESAKDNMVCSEYAAWIYHDLFPDWYKTNPKNLYDSPGFNHILANNAA